MCRLSLIVHVRALESKTNNHRGRGGHTGIPLILQTVRKRPLSWLLPLFLGSTRRARHSVRRERRKAALCCAAKHARNAARKRQAHRGCPPRAARLLPAYSLGL